MPVDELECDIVKKKIEKVKHRRYITSGTVFSLPRLFHVPKGYSDIHLLYDLTSCGLNKTLWDTKFRMPSVEKNLDTATHSSWFGAVYSSEIFHNYTLSEKAYPYSGVDVSWSEKGKALSWERWIRTAVGILSSPFATTRVFT